MKTLYVMRHAKSSWENLSLSDQERPLSDRGKNDAPEMGRRLAAKNILPAIIVSSPARRARKTAKKVAKQIGYPKEKIQLNDELYFSGVRGLVDTLRNTPDVHKSLMIFGHNPDFTDLINHFTGAGIINVPTAGVVQIDFDIASWSELKGKQGVLVFFDYPKKK
ncbi:MAG: histidine phosphatase family protein [Cyclobacteriaceae bacterium]